MSPSEPSNTGAASAPPLDPAGSSLGRRRGCLGSIVSGGFGCFAFLVGAALAIAVAAPQLLSGVAADAIERQLEGQFAGDFEVYDLELHWRELQRARRVTVHTLGGPDGAGKESLAEFSLRFPSLFDLLSGPSKEWYFKITDAKFIARVDADGTSDLGRCLGLQDGDQRSEIAALLGALASVSPAAEDAESGARSVRTVINSSSLQFIDMASGTGTDRAEATLSGFRMLSVRSRVGYQVELTDALVEHSVDQKSQVALALNFGSAAASGPEAQQRPGASLLRSAELSAEPIPLDVLRLIGAIPRGERREGGSRVKASDGVARDLSAAVDLYRPAGSVLLRGLKAFFEDGASLEVSYGSEAMSYSEGAGSPAGSPPGSPPGSSAGSSAGEGRRLAISAFGDFGEVVLAAVHDGRWLTGSRTASGESALSAGFRLAPGSLKSFVELMAPTEGMVVEDQDSNASWYLKSDRFQIPFSAEDLTLASFFGAEAANPRLGRDRGAAGVRRTDPSEWARLVARRLRRTDAELQLFSRGEGAAKLVLMPSDEKHQRAYDRLDWTHRLTKMTLSAELGGTVSSTWRIGQSAVESAELTLRIPGAALVPGDTLVPRFSFRVPEVPVTLIQSMTQLPQDLALLLPKRLDRLALEGLPLHQLLRPAGAPRRAFDDLIKVTAIMDTSDRVEGTYRRGTMKIPKAVLTTPLDDFFCRSVIQAYMPWFESVEPSDGGALRLELRDFEFSLGQAEFKQVGQVTLRSSPLRVRLLPEIARKLTVSEVERAAQDEDDSDLVAWTPSPTVLTLDGLRVGYERIELPLSDDYVTTLDGSFYRGDGKFSLSGLVESQFIQGPGGEDTLWLVAINGTAAGERSTASVTFDPGTINTQTFDELMRRAAELGDKAK